MGGKKATTTSSVSIPPEVLARYNAVNTRAETAATAPYEAFGKTAADYVAQMNAQQGAGINDINATAGSYQPYMTQATTATQAGLGPAYEDIDRYMSPYIKKVADTTGAYLRQQQEQAQSGALGTAISSGAFGGDRAGIAAANLQQQNQMAYGKTMADIMNQGYTQALEASQADLARQLQGGSQLADLGAQSQQLGLQGAQAKIAAGTMQQQTEQAGKDAMINQFMQEKGYPFQTAQFLASIATGTGAATGSTTTTQTPRNWLGFASGGAVEGGVAGPMSYSQGAIGSDSYVPAADLPVGQLMIADPPEQGKSDKTDEIIKMITMAMGAARGGAIDQRHGYALDGGVSYPALNTEELRRKQEIRKQLSAGTGIIGDLNQDALMRASLNPANMGLAGRPAPQMVAPTGVAGSKPAPVNAIKELNLGGTDAYNAAGLTSTAQPVVVESPTTGLAPPPTPKAEPKSYFIDGQTWIRHPNGLVTDFLENPIDVNAARGILYQIDLQDRAEINKSLAQSYGSLSQVHRDKLALTQRNKDALLGMYQGEFPVSEQAQNMATAMRGSPSDVMQPVVTTGVVAAPAMTARPDGVQQPMNFMAGEKPSYMLPTDLGTPPSGDLAPATSLRPQPRPADLGTPPVVEQPKPELGAGIIVGNTMMPAPEGIGYDKDRLAAAVRFQESGSPSGNYGVLGAPVQRKDGSVDRAYGAYQIMGANIPQWTKEVLGYSMTPEEFLRDPQAQDTVAKAKLDQMYQQYGSIEDVASVWFSGRPLNNNNSIDKTSGKSVPSYVSDVMNKYYGGGEGSATNYNRGSVNDGVASFEGLGGADMTRQRDGLFRNEKPYEDRNAIGKFFYNPDGSMNSNAVMALLGGLARGAEAQTISPLGGILAGLGGGMETYKGLVKQEADIAQTQALTNQTNIEAAAARFRVGPDKMPIVIMPDGSNVDYYTFKNSPELQAQLGSAQTAAIVKAAEAAGVAAAASAPDAGIYNTSAVQSAYNNEEATLRSLQGDRTASNAIVTNIGNAAAAAGGNTRANTFMQLNAFADLNGNPAATQAGYAASARAAAVQAVNFASSVLGMEPISNMSESAAIIAKSKSILASTAAQQLDAETATALNVIMTSLPDIEQDPRASAKLMASVVQAQQRAIDLKNFTDGYISSKNGNRTLTAFDAEKVFNDKTAQLYEQEKPYLETLILTGGDPSKVDPTSGMTPMQLLTSGQLNPQETADVLAQLFPQGYPSHLVTTFSR